MYCQNRISYRVQDGDSLYRLARQFDTTVTELILLNSGANPYNLRSGMKLTICPGPGYDAGGGAPNGGMPGNGMSNNGMPNRPAGNPGGGAPGNGMPNRPMGSPVGGGTGSGVPTPPPLPDNVVMIPGIRPTGGGSDADDSGMDGADTDSAADFRGNMRLAWLDHNTLVKFYLTAFFDNLSSQNAWKNAVRDNMDGILGIFSDVYPTSVMQRLRSLTEQHLTLTDEVAAALKENSAATQPLDAWYANAGEIAVLLAGQTIAYDAEKLQKMLYEHLDMVRQQMEAYLDGEYETDVTIFLKSQKNILELADFLAGGLMARGGNVG